MYWPAILAEMSPPQRRLTLSLGASLLLHAVLLTIHFADPDLLGKTTEHALDVVLVNSKHKEKPLNAQARAQANLDGGGNVDSQRLATSPLPPSFRERTGSDLLDVQRKVAALEALQKQMLTRAKSDVAVNVQPKRQDKQPPSPDVNGKDFANKSMAISQLEAAIDKQLDEYNKRPRKKFIGARAEEYLPARYLEEWRNRIEKVGNLNYPPEARGKLYGNVVIYLELNSRGEILKSEMQKSSGQPALDKAAMRIIRLASPYGNFTDAMRRQFDVIGFTRVLTFTPGNQLESHDAPKP